MGKKVQMAGWSTRLNTLCLPDRVNRATGTAAPAPAMTSRVVACGSRRFVVGVLPMGCLTALAQLAPITGSGWAQPNKTFTFIHTPLSAPPLCRCPSYDPLCTRSNGPVCLCLLFPLRRQQHVHKPQSQPLCQHHSFRPHHQSLHGQLGEQHLPHDGQPGAEPQVFF